MVVDGAWASIVLFLALVSNMSSGWHRTGYYLITAVMFGLMVVRRRWPGPTVVAAMLLGLLQVLANIEPDASSIGYLVFVYTGAAFAVPWISRFALVSGLLAGPLTVGMLHKTSDDGSPAHGFLQQAFVAVLLSTPFILCWAWGRLTRVRGAYLVELEDRAQRLERERDAQAQVAVAAERARIARELHDVVAHNVSVMIVQADGAAYVMDNSPQQAKEALNTIASTGRQALVEMRRLLGVLRTADATEEYVPQPAWRNCPTCSSRCAPPDCRWSTPPRATSASCRAASS